MDLAKRKGYLSRVDALIQYIVDPCYFRNPADFNNTDILTSCRIYRLFLRLNRLFSLYKDRTLGLQN